GLTCQPYPGNCAIAGGSGSANSGTVLISTDYTTWSTKTSSLATTTLNDIAFFNNEYITVGDSGALFVSVNSGTDWITKTSGAGTNDLNSLSCGALGCVAIGDAGTIVFSATGNIWGLQTSGTTNNLNRVVLNGVFVAVGSSGTILQSANGVTWAAATFPATSSNTTGLNSIISN
ncbi:MAG TPA: hypothetical protein VKR58_05220, partial [Aquella sp.]|nr:hypothetical protein [Aquella sp.]